MYWLLCLERIVLSAVVPLGLSWIVGVGEKMVPVQYLRYLCILPL